jgi:hypothetical protein
MSSKKSIQLVSFEALVVGVCLVVLVYIVKKYITIPNITGYPMDIELFIIVGALFHILFEYSGVNLWYSLEYCKLVKM